MNMPANSANMFTLYLSRLREQLGWWLDYGQPVSHVGAPLSGSNATHKGTRRLKPFYPLGASASGTRRTVSLSKCREPCCQERLDDSIHCSVYHLKRTKTRKNQTRDS